MVKSCEDSPKLSELDDIVNDSECDNKISNSFSETKLSKKHKNNKQKQNLSIYSSEHYDDTFIKPFNFNLIKGDQRLSGSN